MYVYMIHNNSSFVNQFCHFALFQHITKPVSLAWIFFISVLVISKQDLRSAFGDQKDQAPLFCLIRVQLDHIRKLSGHTEFIFGFKREFLFIIAELEILLIDEDLI